MGYVVTFKDYMPTPRYDGQVWTNALIQEAVSKDGPWVTIQNIPLAPLDADPENPGIRNFTTELGTIEEGWYRIVFADATADQVQPTAPVQNKEDDSLLFRPSVFKVASLIRARTKDKYGTEVGTFNADTRPTYQQVESMITMASDEIASIFDTDVPEEMYPWLKSAVAIKTAMLIEISYFPEQVGGDRTAYAQLSALLDKDIEYLMAALAREQAEDASGDESAAGAILFNFPSAEPLWTKRM